MADIFLSYAREDEVRARTLAAALGSRGWSVFWDRRIPHGSNFRDYIQQQLDSARCLVVLWSNASLASQFVLDEATEGLHDGRLVPALIEAVRQPLGFRGLQAANLTDWHGAETAHDDFERLVVSIGAIAPPSLQSIELPSSAVSAGPKSSALSRNVTSATDAADSRAASAGRHEGGRLEGADPRAAPNEAQAAADENVRSSWKIKSLFVHPARAIVAVIVLFAIIAMVVWWWLPQSGGTESNGTESPRNDVAQNPPDAGRGRRVDGGAVVGPADDLFKPIMSGVRIPRTAEELGLRKRLRPVQPGASIGTIDVDGTGTICCIVGHSDGSRYLLSDVATFHGSIVIQPGAADQGRESDQIGTLATRFNLDSGMRYEAFAGIVRLLPTIAVSSDIPGLGRMGNLARDVRAGQIVRMVGRTSGLVEGKVTAVNVTESIAGYNSRSVSVGGLIRTTPLSQGGDAGAPVLTINNELVGMVVAGSEDSTIVMPLRDLLESWKLALIQ
jgi:hypothetical protein